MKFKFKHLIIGTLLIICNAANANSWCGQGIYAEARFKAFEICINFSEETERVNKFLFRDKNGEQDLTEIYKKYNLLEIERTIIEKRFTLIQFYSLSNEGNKQIINVKFSANKDYLLSVEPLNE